MATVIVIDGLGGGIGVQLVGKLREISDNKTEIIALGTNATATERMLKAGAHRGATGENAIRVTVRQAAIILGPIGIVIPDSMMGEITAAIANAVLTSPAERILLPLQNEHFTLAGLEQITLAKAIDKAIELFTEKERRFL
jgi:hypothetical protein